jgi:DNA primase
LYPQTGFIQQETTYRFDMTIDLARLKASVDLKALVQMDVTLVQRSKVDGGEWWGPCPFCGGGQDRFHVWPIKGRFWCRMCDRKGDALAYVAERQHLDLTKGPEFRRACEILGAAPEIELPTRTQPLQEVPTPPKSKGPSSEWQSMAAKVTATCAGLLWSAAGTKARIWLNQRGLKDETLRRWKIGLNPANGAGWRTMHGLSIPCGVVIPGEVDGSLWYLKVRRARGKVKYQHVKGSRPALYMAETLRGQETAFLTEGEFDALLLWQEAGDLAGVATLGSAAASLDNGQWGRYLAPIRRLLLSYDADQTGQSAADKLVRSLAQARRVDIPIVRDGDKDLTDFCRRGGRLRDWVAYEMASC